MQEPLEPLVDPSFFKAKGQCLERGLTKATAALLGVKQHEARTRKNR